MTFMAAHFLSRKGEQATEKLSLVKLPDRNPLPQAESPGVLNKRELKLRSRVGECFRPQLCSEAMCMSLQDRIYCCVIFFLIARQPIGWIANVDDLYNILQMACYIGLAHPHYNVLAWYEVFQLK